MLRYLFLISALLCGSSWAGLTQTEFTLYIEDMCFRNDENIGTLLVNGQEKPLASTLENFIALAEKFEVENPNIDLKNEVFFFLRNFTYENIDFLGNVITQWRPSSTDYVEIEKLWEPDDMTRKSILPVQDPFTHEEKCSLFFMLSHSIIRSPMSVTQNSKARSYVNASTGGILRSDINLESLYPQETGVVSIRGTDAAVALSRVLTGIYVGLNEGRRRTLGDFKRLEDVTAQFPTDEPVTVDPLYVLTLGEVLMLAKWNFTDRKSLAPNGEWRSMPIGNERDVKNVCPMVYKLPSTNSSYSYSSVRGAADGLILGKMISPLVQKARDVKLSQILRMYYSNRGIIGNTEDSPAPVWASFCNREANLVPLEETLKNQMLMFGFLSSSIFVGLSYSREEAWKYYQNEKSSIYGLWDTTLKNYCDIQLSLDKVENLPLETPLDITVVLDSSEGQGNLEKQQLIVGHMAKEMDLRYYGSRMTILTDHRDTASSSGMVKLIPVVEDTYSRACASCRVVQNDHPGTAAPRDEVIFALDQLLQAKKDNETKLSGVKGKVVVYFSFEEDEVPARGNKEQARLNKALRDLHMRHQDVLFYAVGKNPEILRKYVRQDTAFVLSAVGENEEVDGHNLFLKVSVAPATLQYKDCKEAKNEAGADYEGFVSPNAIQHWEMPPEYFYKSTYLKFFFHPPQESGLRVCHSRATISPEREASTCKESTKNVIEFIQSNPCKSFTKDTCSPFYFSVIGINNTEGNGNGKPRDYCKNTQDSQCSTLDQFRFKVSHQGVRCSGCIGLIATPIVLLFAVIFSHILRNVF